MIFRLLVPLILAFSFILYLGYLNPSQVTFIYAPGRSMEMPYVVLLLLSAFAGVFCLGLFLTVSTLGEFLRDIGRRLNRRKQEKVEKLLFDTRMKVESGEMEKALKIVEKVFSKDSKNLEALLLKGKILRDIGKTKEAVAVHSLALALYPTETDLILQLKEDYISVGHLDAAYKMLEMARGRKPDDAGIIIQMREIAEKKSDLKHAVVLQREALKRLKGTERIGDEKRKLAELYCVHARFLLGKGDVKGSKAELHLAMKSSHGFIPASVMLARLAVEESKIKDAEKVLKKEFKQSYSIALLRILEAIYRSNGQEEKIEDLYDWGRSVMANSPDAKYLLLFIAMAQIEKRDFTQANGTLSRAGRFFSETVLFHLALGVVEAGMSENGSQAPEQFVKALEIEWERFLEFRCDNCGYESADYFIVCDSCGKWSSGVAKFR